MTRERVPLDLGARLRAISATRSGRSASARAALHGSKRPSPPIARPSRKGPASGCRSTGRVTQNNLGKALRTLGKRESGTAQLEAGCRRLSRRAQGNDPRAGAAQLGARPRTISATRSGRWASARAARARLEEAVAAYRDALKERTRERVPLDWAKTTGNQGVAFMLLAERTGDSQMAKNAVSQIDLALAAIREGGHAPLAEYYEAQLPKARSLVERLSKH